LIVVAGLWAYHNSFHGPFIFDDVPSISGNPHIRHLWPIWQAMSAPPGSPVAGRSVVCLTLALNYAWGGLNVWGYHAVNLTVHLVSALVLFGIWRRTFEGEKLRDRFGGAAVWLAGALALIWEVHPLQTESVTYIAQRTESLRIDSGNAGAHNALGSVLARQGNLAEAEQEFNQALRRQPDYAEAQANLGFAPAQLGRLDEAVRRWETAVRLDPKQANARHALDRARGGGE
jgi:tetratricopeptide (TPR) repeat protein